MFLVESYHAERPDSGPLPYAAFIAFFPHLIAGPIVSPREIMPQLMAVDVAVPRADHLAEGMMVFLLGLAKKLVLADMFARFADVGFNAAAQGAPLSLVEAWYAAGSYALQIYFDFSGYSDMAIGLACMLNVRFPQNFTSPYQATNISEFWHCWHITLSRFLREQVYIPLGGNRRGEARRNFNVLLTMLLGGLWHGAAWNFVLWGGLHGLYLVIHGQFRRTGATLPPFVGRPLTLLAVVIAWVPFRAGSLHATIDMLRGMAGLQRLRIATDDRAGVSATGGDRNAGAAAALSRRRAHAELSRGHGVPGIGLDDRAGNADGASIVGTRARLGADHQLRIHHAGAVFRPARDAVSLLPILMVACRPRHCEECCGEAISTGLLCFRYDRACFIAARPLMTGWDATLLYRCGSW